MALRGGGVNCANRLPQGWSRPHLRPVSKRTLRCCAYLLVEDHMLFRDALALTLNRQPDAKVAGQCGSLWLRHDLSSRGSEGPEFGVAHVCRRSCLRLSGGPACRSRGLKCRLMIFCGAGLGDRAYNHPPTEHQPNKVCSMTSWCVRIRKSRFVYNTLRRSPNTYHNSRAKAFESRLPQLL